MIRLSILVAVLVAAVPTSIAVSVKPDPNCHDNTYATPCCPLDNPWDTGLYTSMSNWDRCFVYGSYPIDITEVPLP